VAVVTAALLAAQAVLVAVALANARTSPEDRPFASYVAYVLGSELVRLAALAALPLARPLALPAVDLLWMGQFGAQVWLARRVADGRTEDPRVVVGVGAHAAATVGIAVDCAVHRAASAFAAVRPPWLRASAAALSAVAYLRLLRGLLRGRVGVGVGLGLAASVLSIFQMLHYAGEPFHRSYQVAILTYLILGITVLSTKLLKGAMKCQTEEDRSRR
jgi:hypothetical protein